MTQQEKPTRPLDPAAPLTDDQLESIAGGNVDLSRATLGVDEDEVLPLRKRSSDADHSGSSNR